MMKAKGMPDNFIHGLACRWHDFIPKLEKRCYFWEIQDVADKQLERVITSKGEEQRL